MKKTIQINSQNIKDKVMYEIKKAKTEILATMHTYEEQKNPLPKEYFSLLEKKHTQGVNIKRVSFGVASQYKKLMNTFKAENLFFIGKHTKSKNYKRMILIDKSKVFFRRNKKFYFSKDPEYIKKYLKYFNRLEKHFSGK